MKLSHHLNGHIAGHTRTHHGVLREARRALTTPMLIGLVGIPILAVLVPRTTPTSLAETSPVTEPTPPVTSAYLPLGPIRVLDTRASGHRPAAGATLAIALRDRAEVPDDTAAVSVTITATDPAAPGWISAWGDGPLPATSTLNLDERRQTRANAAIVPLGADGAMRLATQSGAHLVVDLTGVFRPIESAALGRFVALGPTRLLDTRTSATPLGAHEVRTIDATVLGVPPDASAIAVDLTAIAADAWFAVWPTGEPWPGTSTVHTDRSGAPITASAIVPVRDGRLQLTGSAIGHVVIDVNGWFTGPSAPVSSEGLFVPVPPTRIADTRGDRLASPRVEAGGTIVLRRFPFDASTAGAVAINVTTVHPLSDGFVAAWPAATPRPTTSVANVERDRVVAASAIVPASVEGVAVFTQSSTHLVVDVTGWFTTAARSLPPKPIPTPTANTSYSFALVHADGRWARWDPCRTITVAVDFTDAQPGARAALASVVDETSAATGIDLDIVETVVDGAPIDGAIGVRWAPTGALPMLVGNVIGLGGFGATTERILWGTVIVRSDVDLGVQPGGDDLLRFVLAHELAHALGLGHVDDPTQLMNPYSSGHDTFQDGDRTGLALVGAASGCIASPRSEPLDLLGRPVTVIQTVTS